MLIGGFNADKSGHCLSQFLFEINEKIMLRNLPVIKVLVTQVALMLLLLTVFQVFKYQDNINIRFSEGDYNCFMVFPKGACL